MEISVQDVENPRTPLAASMRRELDNLSPLSSECCIYRVPERLRSVNEKAYTPKVVSIGPLHHGKDGLKGMEEHKMRYLRDYIQRTNESLEYYIEVVKTKEPKLRSCYAETIGFSSDKFVKIILADSAFIIEVLLRYCIQEFQEEPDRMFKKPWMVGDIFCDLHLLENQLPFFILEDLFDPNKIEFPPNSMEFSISKFSHLLVTDFMRWTRKEKYLKKMSSTTILHFVDILRNLFVPESPHEGKECKKMSIPSMTELHQAGVQFKVRSSENLLDIDFKNGILEIPTLTVHKETENTFRNLVAFEQCHFPIYKRYLSDYVLIMDCLVNVPKDEELLVKYEIVNLMGDRKLAWKSINKLADGITANSSEFYFTYIFDPVNKYHDTSWHKWKANLKQRYFNTPWVTISVIAAGFVIVLTIIQAVCSLISVI